MNKLLVDKGFVPEGTVFIPADTDAIIKKAFEMNGKKFPLKNINQRHYQNLMPILLYSRPVERLTPEELIQNKQWTRTYG